MQTNLIITALIVMSLAVLLQVHDMRRCRKMRCGDTRHIRYNGKIYFATYSCSTRRGWYWFEFTVENEYIDVEIHYTDIL